MELQIFEADIPELSFDTQHVHIVDVRWVIKKIIVTHLLVFSMLPSRFHVENSFHRIIWRADQKNTAWF